MIMPHESVYWLLQKKIEPTRLSQSTSTQVAIVGGGLAGLSAAQAFAQRGYSVVVLEKTFCGSGASGLSSGFITPNSELGLSHYVRVLGPEKAKLMWDFVRSGVSSIQDNITKYDIACDYIQEDTLIVANTLAGYGELVDEYKAFEQLGYGAELYSKDALNKLIGSQAFDGGMSFGDTFGINCFAYLQSMKRILTDQGVKIYEETPALSIEGGTILTHHGTIKADTIIVSVDHWLPSLNIIPSKVFQVQTFAMASETLDDQTINKIFPHKRYMMWDTDLVYQYYRMTHDNRFVIGGATMWKSYQYSTSCHPTTVVKKLARYVQEKFPQVSMNFEYVWPGMIGISKDLAAIAGTYKNNKRIYILSASTGLPWAAALGNYAAQHLIEGRTDLDEIFSPERSFPLPDALQYVIGKANTFALSDFISLKLM